MAFTYSLGSCIRNGSLQRFAYAARFRVAHGQRTFELPPLTRGFFVGSAPWKQADTKTKGNGFACIESACAGKAKVDDEGDEDLFESMLGDWDGHDDDGGKVVKIKPGDVHEGVDNLGAFSAGGVHSSYQRPLLTTLTTAGLNVCQLAGGAVVATLAALVIFAGGTALVMGAVRSISTLKPGEQTPSLFRGDRALHISLSEVPSVICHAFRQSSCRILGIPLLHVLCVQYTMHSSKTNSIILSFVAEDKPPAVGSVDTAPALAFEASAPHSAPLSKVRTPLKP
eukprot:1196149-Prorocentrum_minimum.AAC.10